MPPIVELWSVVEKAVKAVPALKYAVGIAGIVGLLAIIQAWNVDPKYGTLGVIVALILMTGLLVFARLAVANPEIFLLPMTIFLWAAVILVIASATLTFTAFFLGWPPIFPKPLPPPVTTDRYIPTPGDRKVYYYEGLVEGTHAKWNTLQDNDADSSAEIQEAALTDAKKMESVGDQDLGVGGKLIKFEYLCFSYVIAADVESATAKRSAYAMTARNYCSSAKTFQKFVEENKDKDDNFQATQGFIDRNHEQEFVDYLFASTFCTSGIALNDQSQVEVARKLLGEIPSWYVKKSRPHGDRIFRNCVTGDAG